MESHLVNPMPVISEECSYTDILIVSAGPSGFFLAQGLARLDLEVRLIERR